MKTIGSGLLPSIGLMIGTAFLGACHQKSAACAEETLQKWALELGINSLTIRTELLKGGPTIVHVEDSVVFDSGTLNLIADFAAWDLLEHCASDGGLILFVNSTSSASSTHYAMALEDSALVSGPYRQLVAQVIRNAGRDDLVKMNAIFPMLQEAFPGFNYKGDLWGALSDYINGRNDYCENPEELLTLFVASCDYPEFDIHLPDALRIALPPTEKVKPSKPSQVTTPQP